MKHSIGWYAGMLSITEIGLGAFLHMLRIPLRGTFLSINQGALLTEVAREGKNGLLPAKVSAIAALLKSLSPGGQKLTPMVAIAMQGALFSSGLLLLGCNIAGLFLATLLLSLWGVLQPLMLLLLIQGFSFGTDFLDLVATTLAKSIPSATDRPLPHFFLLLLLFIAVKFTISFSINLFFWYSHRSRVKILGGRSLHPRRPSRKNAPWRGAFNDLLQPIVLLPLFFATLFYLSIRGEGEISPLLFLRPLLVAYLLFFIARLLPIERWLENSRCISLKEAWEMVSNELYSDESSSSLATKSLATKNREGVEL